MTSLIDILQLKLKPQGSRGGESRYNTLGPSGNVHLLGAGHVARNSDGLIGFHWTMQFTYGEPEPYLVTPW